MLETLPLLTQEPKGGAQHAGIAPTTDPKTQWRSRAHWNSSCYWRKDTLEEQDMLEMLLY